MSNHARTMILKIVIAIIPAVSFAQSSDLLNPETIDSSSLSCPRYKVYYIDPSAQFFTPPVPLEDHAEYVFCSDHENLDVIRAKLAKMKPIGSHADAGAARIKIVPKGRPADSMIFCSTGEITFRGKQYRLDRRTYEPSLLSLREEGDRQRSMAIEKEDEDDPRGPASEKNIFKTLQTSPATSTAETRSDEPTLKTRTHPLPVPIGPPAGF